MFLEGKVFKDGSKEEVVKLWRRRDHLKVNDSENWIGATRAIKSKNECYSSILLIKISIFLIEYGDKSLNSADPQLLLSVLIR